MGKLVRGIGAVGIALAVSWVLLFYPAVALGLVALGLLSIVFMWGYHYA